MVRALPPPPSPLASLLLFRLVLSDAFSLQTGDGQVGVDDLLALLSNYGQVGERVEDISADGLVNVDDLLLLLAEYGRQC